MPLRDLALLIVAAGVCAGCATPTQMAYSPGSKTAVKPTNAVLLTTATIRNACHESFQPHLLVVNVERAGGSNKADRLNFKADDKARFNEADSRDAGNTYLVRMELPPGEYVIRGLACISPRLGPVIPLLDQAVAGASGGTFDVVVSDHWNVDEASFRSAFPQLGGVSIQKSILSPFDRALAQDWWEKH